MSRHSIFGISKSKDLDAAIAELIVNHGNLTASQQRQLTSTSIITEDVTRKYFKTRYYKNERDARLQRTSKLTLAEIKKHVNQLIQHKYDNTKIKISNKTSSGDDRWLLTLF